MFGKKENNTTPPPVITARIETMPGAFYGGSDPIIYPEQSEKIAASPLLKKPSAPVPPPAPPMRQATPPAAPAPASPQVIQKPALQKPVPKAAAGSKKMLFVIVGVLLLLGIGAGVYIVFFSSPTTAPVVTTPTDTTPFNPSPVVVAPTPTTTVPVEIVTSTASSTPAVRGGGALTLPHIAYAPARDDDADSLSNSEEEVFGTDPEVYDTDSDGYYDGQEVANLYNPKGIAPQKIIDSGLVREYINPTFQYRFYYPTVWRVDAVLDDFKDILVSADSGDYIEIRVFPKDESTSFAAWFASTLPGESFSSFTPFQNRFQVPAYKRADNQVGFFETPKAIYSIVYFYGEQEKNAFSHVMNVLLQSFRVSKNGFELPAQVILPGVVSSTPLAPVPAVTSTPSVSTTTSSTVNILIPTTTTSTL